MRNFKFVRVSSVAEACALLTELGPAALPVAGGTDLLIKAKRGAVKPVAVVDLSDLTALKYVRLEDGMFRIGALTPLASVAADPSLRQNAACLAQAAGMVGSRQIRNIATLGGNLCNAAPSAETAAPLLALDARVRLTGPAGEREVFLSDFFLGPGRTCLAAGEIMTEIVFSALPEEGKSVYLKHTRRRAMDVATVGVAAVYGVPGSCAVKIALNAVAPTPIRVSAAEEFLAGALTSGLTAEVCTGAAGLAASAASPIDDVRASAAYRRHIVGELTARALEQVIL